MYPPEPELRSALRLAAVFGVARLLLQFALTLWSTHLTYGYFRDEFYYLACGRHLAWGFVDHGPLVAVQARLGEWLFGRSVFGIRVLSAVAESVALFLTGVTTYALGGRRAAQSLSMSALFLVPIFVAMGGFLSMNSCEPMFWLGCILALVLLGRGASAVPCWIAFGVSAGLGLLNKPSMAFLLVAIGCGLLLTAQRRWLFTREAALGLGLMFLIATPNLLWQMRNHWPTLEFLRNGRIHHKNTALPPLEFLVTQIKLVHTDTVFLWGAGVVSLLRAQTVRHTRWLGLTFVFCLAIMLALHAKDYYLAPLYPAYFAAGEVAWERYFATSRALRRGSLFAFPVYQALLVAANLKVLPVASPVFPVAPLNAYMQSLHITTKPSETGAVGTLPQFYADRFGWQEMSDQVVAAYRSLPPADQAQVCVFADNYGEAGALDFLGRYAEPRLPPAISYQNTYWLWGPHGCTGELLLSVTGDEPEELRQVYRDVQIVGVMHNPHSVPDEQDKNIYLLRHRLPGQPFNWATEKNYF